MPNHCFWSTCRTQPVAFFRHSYAANGEVWHCAEHDPMRLPASPVAPDVRLLALQEQIAKALERIADALEGLKPQPTSQTTAPVMCGVMMVTDNGLKYLCTRAAEHGGAHTAVAP